MITITVIMLLWWTERYIHGSSSSRKYSSYSQTGMFDILIVPVIMHCKNKGR